MWIPAILTVLTILYTRMKFPNPSELENSPDDDKSKDDGKQRLPRIFWYYSLFTFISVLGFVHFTVLSYHFMAHNILSESFIPALYAVAMAIDGGFALLIGKFYDKIGFTSLVLIPVLTLPMAFFRVFKEYCFSHCFNDTLGLCNEHIRNSNEGYNSRYNPYSKKGYCLRHIQYPLWRCFSHW